MNWFRAEQIKATARGRGIRADVMGVPPRPGYGKNERPDSNTVVFWVGDFDHEFADPKEAEKFLADLLRQRSKRAATG